MQEEIEFANLICAMIILFLVLLIAINCWWIGKKAQTSDDPMDWHQMCR